MTLERMILAAEAGSLLLFGNTEVTSNVVDWIVRRNWAIPLVFDEKSPSFQEIMISERSKSSTIVNCVVAGRPVSARARLIELGFQDVIDYPSLFAEDPKSFPLPFCDGAADDVSRHSDRYEWLRQTLADQASIETLDAVLNLRTRGLIGSPVLQFNLAAQYWDPLVPIGSMQTFFDGGSFDGANTLEFIRRTDEYQKIWVIEPSQRGAKFLRTALPSATIQICECVLGAARGTALFDDSVGSRSHLEARGAPVAVETIDHLVSGKRLDYLKLDIEGSELSALEGASQTIATQKPYSAICVYHKQSHFWEIPMLMLKYNPDYRIYLRHYTEGVFETVMYFT